MVKVIAIIPARSGSKSIKNKNLQKINGKSLLCRSIEFALSIKNINRVIVSTDSLKYQKLSLEHGAECPFLRPKKFAQDRSYDIDAFLHCLKWLKKNENYHPDIIINLRPTYPFRKKTDFIFALKKIIFDTRIDSIKSVYRIPFPLDKTWLINKKNFLRNAIHQKNDIEYWNSPRQELKNYFVQNGNIDILRANLIYQKKMSGQKIYPIIQDHFYDIDTWIDLKRVKKLKTSSKI